MAWIDTTGLEGFSGKTLRDEFAIAALPICYELVRDSLIQEGTWDQLDKNEHDYIAYAAYAMADSMIKARIKQE